MAAHEPSNQVARQQFVEEINYNEIKRLEVVGKGSFGVVWKGRWREKLVAVKHINSEAERKAFTVEVRQLSRVSHPNIVKLYGACTREPHVCLVMEYAEGGSLYNVLHCKPQPRYTAAHAMSWALQCAQGVEYLHAMKPKPLIHRDLKPPNLLLLLGGQRLKICDFGTAADQSTYMTNNKGSAAWMAPEVFECTSYTEKCDVFSWGVILWEVLSRHKPFDHNGRSAYQIMWAVHMGNRPPLLRGCPRPIEKLMVACWEKNPSERPSMGEVVRIMSALCQFFPGAEEPVEYSSDESWIDDAEDDNESLDYSDYTVGMDNFDNYSQSNGIRNISIPQPNQNMMTPMSLDIDPNAWDLSEQNRDYFAFGNNLNSAPSVTQTEAPADPQVCQSGIDTDQSDPDLDNVYLILDPHLRPVSPDPDGPQSLQVFEEHKKLAQQYFKVQTELAYLSRYRDEVLAKQDSEQQAQRQRLSKLQSERDGLVPLHKNLTRQLEIMKKSGNMSPTEPRTPTNDGWIVVSRQGD